MSYDLAVIGSGGAAFSAAIAARRKNKTVAMIDQGITGGTCVNTGCVPTKALLAAAEARCIAGHHLFPGIRTDAGPVDFPALITGTRALVEQIRADKYIDLAAHHGWHICRGAARFAAGPNLEVSLPRGGIATDPGRALCDRHRLGARRPTNPRAGRSRLSHLNFGDGAGPAA